MSFLENILAAKQAEIAAARSISSASAVSLMLAMSSDALKPQRASQGARLSLSCWSRSGSNCSRLNISRCSH